MSFDTRSHYCKDYRDNSTLYNSRVNSTHIHHNNLLPEITLFPTQYSPGDSSKLRSNFLLETLTRKEISLVKKNLLISFPKAIATL